MTWGAEEALKAMVAYQVESLRFIARRTYCNLEFMRHLRRCSDWQEIAEVQQCWFKDCAADYGEELSRLRLDRLPARPERLRSAAKAHVPPARGGKGGGGRG